MAKGIKKQDGLWVSDELAQELKKLGVPQVCLRGYNLHELFELLPIPTGSSDNFVTIGISRRYFTMGEPKYFCKVSNWKSYNADSGADAMAKAFVGLIKANRLNFNHLEEGGEG